MTFKIMCVGDSITEFVKDAEHCPQGYRYELWKQLVDLGRPFELVGSHSYVREYGVSYPRYKDQDFQDHCNGWGGWKAYDILVGKQDGWGAGRGNITEWLQEVTPDAVLLMVGTNDAWANQTVDNYGAYMESIVRTIQRQCPSCSVVVSGLIPMGTKLGSVRDNVPVYNDRLKDVVAKMNTAEHRVVYCDQYTGYDADVDNACDREYNVHPGVSGAKKIAANFVKALTE